jgi:DNA-binding transcriptional ArsR family regulator
MNTTQHTQFFALGDPTRRAIITRLRKGPSAVGELAREFPVSRPAISQHLRVLERARLVTYRASGARRVYALDPAGFDSLRDYFDRFWTDALDAFKNRIEQDSPLTRAERRNQ